MFGDTSPAPVLDGPTAGRGASTTSRLRAAGEVPSVGAATAPVADARE